MQQLYRHVHLFWSPQKIISWLLRCCSVILSLVSCSLSSTSGSSMPDDMGASGFGLHSVPCYTLALPGFLFFPHYLLYSAHLSTISCYYNRTADVLWKSIIVLLWDPLIRISSVWHFPWVIWVLRCGSLLQSQVEFMYLKKNKPRTGKNVACFKTKQNKKGFGAWTQTRPEY